MNYDEFIKKYNGQAIDYDGISEVQCVDLIKLYLDKVFNIKAKSWGNAKDYYNNFYNLPIKNSFTRIANTPNLVPKKGDIVVWNNGKYGHIAIATGEGTVNWFNSYDQNWGSKEMKLVNHTYQNFLGILRPNDQSKIVIQNNQNGFLGIFDIELYNLLYPDLQNAYNGNIQKLKEHFEVYGMKEGRIASYIFDPKYYLNKYEDLKNNYGNDYKGAFEHFITYGIKEGRRGNEIFDINYYKNNNDDLKSKSNEEACNHFLVYGINEWRRTSENFDVNKYKENNQDLNNEFKDNCKEYYRHYIIFGNKEGRKTT